MDISLIWFEQDLACWTFFWKITFKQVGTRVQNLCKFKNEESDQEMSTLTVLKKHWLSLIHYSNCKVLLNVARKISILCNFFFEITEMNVFFPLNLLTIGTGDKTIPANNYLFKVNNRYVEYVQSLL